MDITQSHNDIPTMSVNSCSKKSTSPLGSFFKRQNALFKSRAIYKQKFVNKRLLDKFKFTGYFLYGIVHEEYDASLAKLTGYTNESCSVLRYDDFQNDEELFRKARKRILSGKPIVVLIDCEEHKNNCELFKYPTLLDVPAFSFTTVYKKRRHSKKPRLITYIDGPFYANSSLSIEGQMAHLKEQIFECITAREQLTDNNFKDLNNTDKGRTKNDN